MNRIPDVIGAPDEIISRQQQSAVRDRGGSGCLDHEVADRLVGLSDVGVLAHLFPDDT